MAAQFDEVNGWEDQLSSLDFWRLNDALTVVQAALLLAGIDPSENGIGEYVEGWTPERQPQIYRSAKAALEQAIRRSMLDAHVEYDENPNVMYGVSNGPIVWSSTTILVSDLKEWLARKGIQSGFFFPSAREEAEYLDPYHPRYAPKLAAAIHAWQAVKEPIGKTPKTALMKWLRENAARFDLTDVEGKPNENGIEECAKVANWEMKGGAPKTPAHNSKPQDKLAPGKKEASREMAKPKLSPPRSGFIIADDEDIPF